MTTQNGSRITEPPEAFAEWLVRMRSRVDAIYAATSAAKIARTMARPNAAREPVMTSMLVTAWRDAADREGARYSEWVRGANNMRRLAMSRLNRNLMYLDCATPAERDYGCPVGFQSALDVQDIPRASR